MADTIEVTSTGDLANIHAGEGDTVIVYVAGDASVEQLQWTQGMLGRVWPGARIAVLPGRYMYVTVMPEGGCCADAPCGDTAE